MYKLMVAGSEHGRGAGAEGFVRLAGLGEKIRRVLGNEWELWTKQGGKWVQLPVEEA